LSHVASAQSKSWRGERGGMNVVRGERWRKVDPSLQKPVSGSIKLANRMHWILMYHELTHRYHKSGSAIHPD